jgi:hypothetical protein
VSSFPEIKAVSLAPKEGEISVGKEKKKYTFTFTTENVEDTKLLACVFEGRKILCPLPDCVRLSGSAPRQIHLMDKTAHATAEGPGSIVG